jgi:hypothetical protein
MIGDVTVVGMTMGDHVLEDIGTSVPQGMIVTIPAEQALRSRDLWRAISQKQIFRLNTGPQASVVQPMQPTDNSEALLEQNRLLQKELADSRAQTASVLAQNAAVLEQLRAQGDLLKNLTVAVSQGIRGAPQAVSASSEGAPLSDDAPTYIPSTIKPQDAEVRIESNLEETKGDISDKRSKLRQLRR